MRRKCEAHGSVASFPAQRERELVSSHETNMGERKKVFRAYRFQKVRIVIIREMLFVFLI